MNQQQGPAGVAERLRKMQKAERALCGRSMITFLRRRAHGVLSAAGIVFGLALAGCAAPAPRIVSAGAGTVATGQLRATILEIRPVPPAAPQGSGAVLAALGASGSGGATAGESEVILRTDGGAVLSIVQADTVGLAAGERVVVDTQPRLHLARPGYSTPTS